MASMEQAHYAERAIIALAGVQAEMLNGLRILAEREPAEAARIGARMARSAELAGAMITLWMSSCEDESEQPTTRTPATVAL